MQLFKLFLLDSLKSWIGVVEDKAWDAQAEASACRFVLGNLLVELQAKGVINAGAFIAKLRQAALQDTDNGPARFGICELLDSLHLHFHEQPSTGIQGAGNPNGVFH